MKVQGNRIISPDGKVKCSLNSAVYALSCGADIKHISLSDANISEIEKFNKYCSKFDLEERIIDNEINHEFNQELWVYDDAYDTLNLESYFLNLCTTNEQKERVLMELDLYQKYNMNKLLRCMIWLVHYMEEHNIFWGLGRGSSCSSYCLFLIGLHLVDSLKYDLDVHEFLKY